MAIRSARRRAGIARLGAAALACLVAGGAMLWPVLPPVVESGGSTGSPPGDATSLSVLSLNTEYGQADPTTIVEQVRHRRVDLLVLLEETPQHWAALQEAGLSELLPHVTGSVGSDAGGSIIASAHPLTCPDSPGGRCDVTTRGERRGSGTAFDQPVAQLADGTLVRQAYDLHAEDDHQKDDGQPDPQTGVGREQRPALAQPVERIAGRNDATVSVEGRRRNREGRHGNAHSDRLEKQDRTRERNNGRPPVRRPAPEGQLRTCRSPTSAR